MPETTDSELLRDFVQSRSNQAFAELTRRHLSLVYSVAWRYVRDEAEAQDVAQAVFIILARKASNLNSKTALAGWLYETTRYTALKCLTAKARRQRREQEAFMQSQTSDTASDWRHLEPHLEEAMSRLGAADRQLLVLRYYENKTAGEAALLLGIGAEAAHKRTARAVAKLRLLFARQGVALSDTAIANAISVHSIQSVPATWANAISATATAQGAAAKTSTLKLVKGALKLMAWTKAKTAAVVGIAVILGAGATTYTVTIHLLRPAEPNLDWANDPARWKLDSRVLQANPPAVMVRPTRFTSGGMVALGASDGDKFVSWRTDAAGLLTEAYGFGQFRMVLPAGLPEGNFDAMLTLPEGGREALKAVIAKQLGLRGRTEVRPTKTLALVLKRANAPGLRASLEDGGSSSSSSSDLVSTISFRHRSLDDFAGSLEYEIQKPITNLCQLPGYFDIDVTWTNADNRDSSVALGKALEAQLGLELVPTNMPMEMLVVEKVK